MTDGAKRRAAHHELERDLRWLVYERRVLLPAIGTAWEALVTLSSSTEPTSAEALGVEAPLIEEWLRRTADTYRKLCLWLGVLSGFALFLIAMAAIVGRLILPKVSEAAQWHALELIGAQRTMATTLDIGLVAAGVAYFAAVVVPALLRWPAGARRMGGFVKGMRWARAAELAPVPTLEDLPLTKAVVVPFLDGGR